MEFKELQKPFKKDGTPAMYLRLLLPFMESSGKATKKDMYKLMGIDLDRNPDKRNAYSRTLAKLNKIGILETNARGAGYWKRGKNFEAFLTYLSKCMLENKTIRPKFTNLLYKYEDNALDFIMKN